MVMNLTHLHSIKANWWKKELSSEPDEMNRSDAEESGTSSPAGSKGGPFVMACAKSLQPVQLWTGT